MKDEFLLIFFMYEGYMFFFEQQQILLATPIKHKKYLMGGEKKTHFESVRNTSRSQKETSTRERIT
jgi:hypothetical protein